MIEIELKISGRSIKRNVPEKVTELSSRQYAALVKYQHGLITEQELLSGLLLLGEKHVKSIGDFHRYKLIELLVPVSDLSQAADRFIIERIPETDLIAPAARLKGISFMQFMFADTRYDQYLEGKQEDLLAQFVSSLYLVDGEVFTEIDMTERTGYITDYLDTITAQAIVLNYMMIKKWLSASYSYMFSSAEGSGSGGARRQKWLDIFDAFVGENIPDTPYYQSMPCMDAFRIINKRMKEYYHAKK